MFKLKGQTAIITGGGRGLGAQIADAFAEAGANIILCSRNIDACEKTSEKLREKGASCLAFPCDVTKKKDVQYVVKKAVNHFEKIDILVNNSGTTWAAPAEEMPLEAWNKVMNVNVTGTFLMTQEVGKVMIKQKKGKIINIASVAGFGGTDPRLMDTVGYNTSKGAVITLTKDLASKWGKHNIHVNAISPGFFPTKMSRQLIEMSKEKILELTPLKRLGTESDLKGAALFLASSASNYVTGDILTVDGGIHAM